MPPLPPTPVKAVTHELHGTTIADPYAWLENAADPAVQRWTEAQNRHTRAVLDQYSGLPALRAQIKKVLTASSVGYTGLQYRGHKLFALKFQPPREQAFLITLDSPDNPASGHTVVDPNEIDRKGTTTIDFYEPSLDGKLVAVSLSEGGSEAGTVHVFDADSGKKLADVVPRVQLPTAGGSVAWNADGSGFYCTHYPRGNERPKEDENFYQQVYFHKLGTPTEEDVYVLGKDLPRIAEIVLETSGDGRHVLATVQNGDGGEFAHYLLAADGKATQLTKFSDLVTAATFGPDEALYMVSLQGAPRGKLLRMPLATPGLAEAKTIVPEAEVAIQGQRITSNAMVANFVVTNSKVYLVDSNGGPSQIRVFDHDGKPEGIVPILPVSSVVEITRGAGDEVLFSNLSFIEPPAWYRFDPATGKTTRTALFSTSPVSFADTEVIRETAVSKDGTKVPMSIVLKKGTQRDGKNPTLLTGYGGFGISQAPRFSAVRRIWLDRGGIVAVANLRGGGEYGEAWHKGGNLTHKQNVFDDFAACAQHLIDEKFTSPDKLAIEGGSNGGLLMGAAFTQHPDMFRAVVAHVGIYDMILHDHHPNGAFNVTEYGSISDPEQFKALYAYSPYHHVKDGTAYPAVFFLTGANDGRVDPANSRKMAARLQATTSSGRPILLHVSFDSGHGAGTSLSKAIERQADVFAFLFEQLGITNTSYVPAGDAANKFFFKDGDRVLFLGDSITEQYQYSSYLELYLTTRFPKWKLSFLNAGIGGDTATGGAHRFVSHVLDEKPTAVTIDFGMNDGGYGAFNLPANRNYIRNTAAMLEMARKAGVRVALVAPNAVDPRERPGLKPYFETQKQFYAPLKELSERFEIPFVDQYAVTRTAIEKMQTDDPQARKVKPFPDGVHTSPQGALLMAHTILTGLRAPALVSEVEIDAAAGKAAPRACRIENLKTSPTDVEFDRTDEALPFPIAPGWLPILPYLNQLKDLNWYGLKIKGLSSGKYDVRIDDKDVGAFTAEQLSGGVNLGNLTTGPLHEQGVRIFNAINSKNQIVHRRFRDVVMFQAPDWLSDVAAERKPKELAKRLEQANLRQAEIYKMVQPATHHFSLKQID